LASIENRHGVLRPDFRRKINELLSFVNALPHPAAPLALTFD